jgi:hypothetical protein
MEKRLGAGIGTEAWLKERGVNRRSSASAEKSVKKQA